MKRDQIVIFVLVGLMTFSAVASGLLLLTNSGGSANRNDDLASQQETEGEPPVPECKSSEDALAATGTPMGDWPTTLDSPLTKIEIVDLREGNGAELKLGDCISVHYRLSLANGTPVAGNNTFEDPGQPIAFELVTGGLIAGWTEGLPGMKEGGYRRLHVPADKAYGANERPGIPANSDLIFDVELIKIES